MEADWLWALGLTVLMIVGAWQDIRYRRLPNWLALLLLAYGLVHCGGTGGFTELLSCFGHTVIALVVGMALFRFGLIGGGDAKFYAGTASYFVFGEALFLLLSVSLSGLLLVSLWIGYRRLSGKKVMRAASDKDKFPYGIAIAAGAILAAWHPFYTAAISL